MKTLCLLGVLAAILVVSGSTAVCCETSARTVSVYTTERAFAVVEPISVVELVEHISFSEAPSINVRSNGSVFVTVVKAFGKAALKGLSILVQHVV